MANQNNSVERQPQAEVMSEGPLQELLRAEEQLNDRIIEIDQELAAIELDSNRQERLLRELADESRKKIAEMIGVLRKVRVGSDEEVMRAVYELFDESGQPSAGVKTIVGNMSHLRARSNEKPYDFEEVESRGLVKEQLLSEREMIERQLDQLGAVNEEINMIAQRALSAVVRRDIVTNKD